MNEKIIVFLLHLHSVFFFYIFSSSQFLLYVHNSFRFYLYYLSSLLIFFYILTSLYFLSYLPFFLHSFFTHFLYNLSSPPFFPLPLSLHSPFSPISFTYCLPSNFLPILSILPLSVFSHFLYEFSSPVSFISFLLLYHLSILSSLTFISCSFLSSPSPISTFSPFLLRSFHYKSEITNNSGQCVQ